MAICSANWSTHLPQVNSTCHCFHLPLVSSVVKFDIFMSPPNSRQEIGIRIIEIVFGNGVCVRKTGENHRILFKIGARTAFTIWMEGMVLWVLFNSTVLIQFNHRNKNVFVFQFFHFVKIPTNIRCSLFVSANNGKTHCWCLCTIFWPQYSNACHSQHWPASRPKRFKWKNYKRKMLYYGIVFNLHNSHQPPHHHWPAHRHINRDAPHSTTNVAQAMATNVRISIRIHRIWAMSCRSLFRHRHILWTISLSLPRRNWMSAIWPIRKHEASDR